MPSNSLLPAASQRRRPFTLPPHAQYKVRLLIEAEKGTTSPFGIRQSLASGSLHALQLVGAGHWSQRQLAPPVPHTLHPESKVASAPAALASVAQRSSPGLPVAVPECQFFLSAERASTFRHFELGPQLLPA